MATHRSPHQQPSTLCCLLCADKGVDIGPWENFKKRVTSLTEGSSRPVAHGVYFPLIAVLLPQWRHRLASNNTGGRQVLYLVSGSGIPRNKQHDVAGNSTEGVARVMERFISLVYPDIQVVQLPSDLGIFRFDDNVAFARDTLLPHLDQQRRKVVDHHGDRWASHLHTTMSLTDGAPARVTAIASALRSYKPDYLHMYELKSFWHSASVQLQDVDFHSFHTVDLSPPRPVEELPLLERFAADSMRSHATSFLTAAAARDEKGLAMHELDTFWLRKSRKPVLSVLVVQRPGAAAQSFPGMNMEVSMPTGSLCAERCAIGQALARDPSLRREHMRQIAVLSVGLEDTVSDMQLTCEVEAAGSGSAGTALSATQERMLSNAPTHAAAAAATALVRHYQSPAAKRRLPVQGGVPAGDSSPPAPPARVGGQKRDREPDAPSTPARLQQPGAPMPAADGPTASPASPSFRLPPQVRAVSFSSVVGSGNEQESLSQYTDVPPHLAAELRAVSSSSLQRSQSGGSAGSAGTASGNSAPVHLNPLPPCGSCSEWLKKIAEVNPDFKVITFTDISCNTAFVKSVI